MAHIQLRHMAAWHPHVGRLRKRRDRRIRPVRPSRRSELAYRADLNGVIRDLRAAGAAVAAELRPHWTGRSGDAALVSDETVPGLNAALQRAGAKFGRLDVQAKSMAALAARRARGDVDQRLSDAIEASVGVNVSRQLIDVPELGRAMFEATEVNVALIKSLPEEYLADIRATVTKSWESGQRWEQLAAEISERGDVAENRAWLIARDQTSKMNASFNEVRQKDLGIDEYIWSGSLDERERPSHREMEGTRHRWDEPPLVDGERVHPGEAILCRCTAIPVVHLEEEPSGGGGLEQEAA